MKGSEVLTHEAAFWLVATKDNVLLIIFVFGHDNNVLELLKAVLLSRGLHIKSCD